MDNLTNQFIKIRNHTIFSATEKMQTFVSDIWDPFIKFTITKEINKMLDTELIKLYPDFPKNLFPQIRIKIDESEKLIEIGIQTYLNQNPELNFLGVSDFDNNTYDFYVRKSL